MEEKGFRPGVVSVVQTFGDRADFHPHVHALITRGGWTGSGERARSVAKMLAGLVAHQLANGGLLDLTTAASIG